MYKVFRIDNPRLPDPDTLTDKQIHDMVVIENNWLVSRGMGLLKYER